MRCINCVLILGFGIFISAARAEVLVNQPLPTWNVGWCSPCSGNLEFHDYRTFGSFTLTNTSVLQGGSFPIYDESMGTYDVHISIWDAPFGNELYSLYLPGGAYSVIPVSAYTYSAAVELPNWELAAGSYWISLFGVNFNPLGWGTDNSSGDDVQYFGYERVHKDGIYVGFSLSGVRILVPEPGSVAMLSLALTGFVLLYRHR